MGAKVDASGNLTNESSSASTILSSTKKNEKSASTLDVNDFLQLLVTQMQYQDPLEPSDNTQYIAQMATFTQVEATTQMQSSVEQQMASNLVGQAVMLKTDKTQTGYISGTVNYWQNIDGTIYLGVEGGLYDIKDLDTVIDDDYYKKYLELIGAAGTDNKTETDKKTETDDKTDTDKKTDTEKAETDAKAKAATDGKTATDAKATTNGKTAADAKAATDTKTATDAKKATDSKTATDTKAATDSKATTDSKNATDSKKAAETKKPATKVTDDDARTSALAGLAGK